MGIQFEQFTVRRAVEADVEAIHRVLVANAADTSLFQQSTGRIRRDLDDFVVVMDAGQLVGCAALHHHRWAYAEILAVAVDPVAHGRGVGTMLMRACLADGVGATSVWLATAKPVYFARHGFQRMSKWRLPPHVLLRKLRLVFEQPVRRWLPALFGRHTFMRLPVRRG